MHLDVLDYLAAAGAGGAAGAINALAGGGTLISFSTLVGLGLPPVTANVTNTVSLVPGYLTGAWAQRDDLRHRIRQAWALAAVAFAGGLFGSVLLIAIPAQAFRVVVPYLILLACGLLLAQDWLRERLRPGNGKNAPSSGANVDAADEPAEEAPAIAPGTGPAAKEKAGAGAGEVAPVRAALVPVAASPSRASPGRASPSRASPSRASPSRASPGRASPSRASPGRASPGRATPGERWTRAVEPRTARRRLRGRRIRRVLRSGAGDHVAGRAGPVHDPVLATGQRAEAGSGLCHQRGGRHLFRPLRARGVGTCAGYGGGGHGWGCRGDQVRPQSQAGPPAPGGSGRGGGRGHRLLGRVIVHPSPWATSAGGEPMAQLTATPKQDRMWT